MTNSPPELLARAKAAAAVALAKPERAHFDYAEREAFFCQFVEGYLKARGAAEWTAGALARVEGAAAERRRWADIVAHPAFETHRDEVLALARTDASRSDLVPVLNALHRSAGIAGRA